VNVRQLVDNLNQSVRENCDVCDRQTYDFNAFGVLWCHECWERAEDTEYDDCE